ncbi:MAG: hypothetical protein KGI60_03710 [Patescibacteria group bacterium]|nr:hypothetical protein [Patescibacteria group bacterium]
MSSDNKEKEVKLKKAFDGSPVTAVGDKIAYALIGIAVVFFLVSRVTMPHWSQSSPYQAVAATKAKKRHLRRKDPPVCADAASYAIKENGISVPVSPDCMSGLVFPNLPRGRLMKATFPGEIRVCLWNHDRCVGWLHTPRLPTPDYHEVGLRGMPHYRAFRLIGDPGYAILEVVPEHG